MGSHIGASPFRVQQEEHVTAARARLRTEVSPGGSFVSIPGAFEGADASIVNAPKISVGVGSYGDSKHPLGLDFVMDPHLMLLDLEAVDAKAFDPKRLLRDLDLLKSAVEKQPEQIRTILQAFVADAPYDEILKVAALVDRLGLSEAKAVAAGGGLLWVLVVVAAVALSSCKDCAHTKGSMRQ
jgi:hypothetical protein